MRAAPSILLALAIQTSGAQDSLNVRALFQWTDPSLPASLAHDNTYNEVWGHARNGREYAIIGSTMGTHFLDITDVDLGLVNEVGFVPGAFQGVAVVHRDMKTFGHHLYIVCDEGPSTLQVVDLQYLPDSVVVVYDSNDLLVRAHNIFIDTLQGRMYSCGGSSQFSVYDLQDPAQPSLLLDLEADVPWWGQTVGYVHDAYVREGIAYCHDEDGFSVVDLSDVNAPQLLGSLTMYPEPGYNHSGWLHEDGMYYAMCDETHGSRMKLMDVSDLSDIQVDTLFGSGVDTLSIAHNAIWQADLLHTSYYHDGYWVWRLLPDGSLMEAGHYDTSHEPHAENYRGAWGVYPFLPSGRVLVSDMQTGLWVLEVDGSTAIAETSRPNGDLLVGPNPTPGPFSVQLPDEQGGQLRLIDPVGRVIWTDHVMGSTYLADLTALADGTYVLEFQREGLRLTSLIMKTSGR
ncbi:MAG: choice-of-anchor B family protein [Flavobacteriales bacterium]|nr:choice-of-anchor B family protein [Flavobacteriales bacterium]